MPTFSLNDYSQFKTGQYSRSLQAYPNSAKAPGYDPDQYIADPGTPAKDAPLTKVDAMVLGTGKGWTPSVAPGDYVSDNTTSGITFLVFNRVETIDRVNVNVGPNGSGNRDFGDSIYIESGDHANLVGPASVQANPVKFTNSSIITGDGTSPSDDNDLVVFGSDQSKDNQTYSFSASGYSGTINNLLAPGSTQSALIIQGSSVSTGNGKDTLLFANTKAGSQIGGNSAGQGNTFSLGADDDLVYFASSGQISGQNVVDLGSGKDTLVFNGSGPNVLSGLTGTGTSVLTIKGFNESGDSIYFNGKAYSFTQQATLTADSGNKIVFS